MRSVRSLGGAMQQRDAWRHFEPRSMHFGMPLAQPERVRGAYIFRAEPVTDRDSEPLFSRLRNAKKPRTEPSQKAVNNGNWRLVSSRHSLPPIILMVW